MDNSVNPNEIRIDSQITILLTPEQEISKKETMKALIVLSKKAKKGITIELQKELYEIQCQPSSVRKDPVNIDCDECPVSPYCNDLLHEKFLDDVEDEPLSTNSRYSAPQ